jgi:xanthine/CO dehydrogenase XdhC/CoxF family maturation factor
MDRRETERLLEAIRQARATGERVAIATVVRVTGSAYRREGTQMLVRESGDYECALSGGCLEPAVADAAARVIATGDPVVVSYDLATIRSGARHRLQRSGRHPHRTPRGRRDHPH